MMLPLIITLCAALQSPPAQPLPAPAAAGELRVVCWNLESGDAAIDWIKERVASEQGVAVWGFSEVDADWQTTLEVAAEATEGTASEPADFKSLLGSKGGQDRLLIVFDTRRLDLLETVELHEINYLGRVRPPLLAKFRDKPTGVTFWFMVNHLYRSNQEGRHTQARQLNEWARGLAEPVIAVGDYNFDYELGTNKRDAGYDLMTKDNIFAWVRPRNGLSTTCPKPRYKPSALDFVFVAGPAKEWAAESLVVDLDGQCPEGPETPDHRPLRAVFTLPSSTAPTTPREPLTVERALEDLEQRLTQLKHAVEAS